MRLFLTALLLLAGSSGAAMAQAPAVTLDLAGAT
jgi:hypothetical protein